MAQIVMMIAYHEKAYYKSLNSPGVYTYRGVFSLPAFCLGELLAQKSSGAVSRSFAVVCIGSSFLFVMSRSNLLD